MMELYLVRMQDGSIGIVLLQEGERIEDTNPVGNVLLSYPVIKCYKFSALAISGGILKELGNV